MNVSHVIEKLTGVAGCPISPDVYSGNEARYITYTYEDERPDLQGDNLTLSDTAYIQVNYFVPKEYNYMADKHKIRDYLEENGFKVTSIRSWVENDITGYPNIRRLLFETNYTETRRKKV
ncbi:MAG: hypothetical protein K1W13_02835 [Lachnospiraceae bacterium]